MTEALEMQARLYKGDHPDVAVCLSNLGALRASLGCPADAGAARPSCLGNERALYKRDHPDIAICLITLARCRHMQGNIDEARTLAVGPPR